MNESHISCNNNYDCSSKELDSLVNLFLQNEAYGARLTGAGWGGCCVAMIKQEKLDFFLKLLSKFYKENYNIDSDNYQKKIFFATKPGQGACIYEMH